MLLTDEDVNAESFETWNAKQHGDPEEIGFLQALRIAYCHGQDSMKKAVERAVLEKLCAGVSMPEADKDCEQSAFEKWVCRTLPSGDVTAVESAWKASSDYDEMVTGPCYTADQLRAYGAACRLKALEDAAVEVETNSQDFNRREHAEAIRAMKGEA